MEIEALWDQPGLVAFECPDCEYLASVIVTLRQRLAQRLRVSLPLVARGCVVAATCSAVTHSSPYSRSSL